MRFKRFLSVFFSCLLMLSCCTLEASADTALPEGAVKGLPEKLTAMDSDGRAVSSESGEYFFSVEDMNYGELYTKDVQLMNLREDKAYHIYLHTEPVSKSGDIDLESGCSCKFYLDGNEVYSGDVNGAGNIDLRSETLDLGYYRPGDSHTLRCSVIWDSMNIDMNRSFGHRVVDLNGTTYLEEPDENTKISGEIKFKWIFYAAVDEEFQPPKTGLLAVSGKLWVCIIAVLLSMIAVLLIFTYRMKKKRK